LQTIRKWAIAIALILLISAAVMMTNYKDVYATPVVTQGAANASQSLNPRGWERTGTFVAGDVIEVELLWNIFWAQLGGFDTVELNGAYYSVLYEEVSITDPSGAVSQYELWLTYDETANQFSYLNATALSLGAGINKSVLLPNGFNFTETFIAGTANLNGTYLGNVTSVEGTTPDYRVYQNGTYDPQAFEFFYARTSFQISRPYESLLYVGIGIIPVSIIFIAIGLIGIRTKRKTSPKSAR